MSDNTTLNPGVAGDVIRDLARQSGASLGSKTQVVALDIGGSSANAELLITAGQRPAAASVPVVLASDQSTIPVQNAIGTANWGQSLAVVAGATATVVNIVSAPVGYQIKGMLCHGTADGYFSIQVDGVTQVSGRTRSTAPMLQLILPNGIGVTTAANVTVRVTNESGSTADYELTLLGS